MTEVSTPAWSRDMAQLCRRTCGWIFLPARDGHRCAAVAAWVLTLSAMASRLSRRPVRVGNSGSPAPPVRSLSQAARSVATGAVRGTARCLRPLPSQRTFAPVPRVTSCLLYTSDAADDLLCVDLG